MTARIYRPAPNAMQSGRGKSKEWVLVHEPASPREIEPLMGYTSTADTRAQIRLTFDVETDAPQEKLDQLLKLTERYCVVYQTIKSGPPVEVKLQRA